MLAHIYQEENYRAGKLVDMLFACMILLGVMVFHSFISNDFLFLEQINLSFLVLIILHYFTFCHNFIPLSFLVRFFTR